MGKNGLHSFQCYFLGSESLRAAKTTKAPLLAKDLAVSPPTPEDAPVITTFCIFDDNATVGR